MRIMVLNCGSSSLKYSVLGFPGGDELARGEAQRVGARTSEPARIVHQVRGTIRTMFVQMPDHATAFEQIMRVLADDELAAVDAIAHRVVHGGRHFSGSVRFGQNVERVLDELLKLAPIHNPPAISLIQTCARSHPHLSQVLVFDTSFHNTIPPRARTYALGEELRLGLGLRKYGFHGISHQYVTHAAATLLRCPLAELNAVSCHLGSGGASLCAIQCGESVDNTMGYTPLQGLMMSTRCGDLDPAVTLRLLALQEGKVDRVENLLNRRSGVLGVSGRSADLRDLVGAQEDTAHSFALQAYLWRLRKYLGAYLVVAAPAQAVIFTDTLGETVPEVRAAVCSGLEELGVELDPEANTDPGALPADVATATSPVRILVVPTNEELAIGREAYQMLAAQATPVPEAVAS